LALKSEGVSLLRGVGVLVVALGVTLAALWLITGSVAVCASFAGGVLALGALGWLLIHARGQDDAPGEAEPDWAVTVAAIDHGQTCVAVVDRAGRLVCANTAYERAFGAGVIPATLMQDDPTRAAWRDGHVRAASGAWSVEVLRAGRGDRIWSGGSRHRRHPMPWPNWRVICGASWGGLWLRRGFLRRWCRPMARSVSPMRALSSGRRAMSGRRCRERLSSIIWRRMSMTASIGRVTCAVSHR
jgi:hypothetical protein